MKKLKQINLDELAQCMPVLNNTVMRSCLGGLTNTGNPNPLADYDVYQGTELWSMGSGYQPGGGEGGSTDPTIYSFQGQSHGFGLDYGLGITGNYSYQGSAIYKNNQLTISASTSGYRVDLGHQFSGRVYVYVNGNFSYSSGLTPYSGGYFNKPGTTTLGETTINLPYSSTGQVKVVFEVNGRTENGFNFNGQQTIYETGR